MYSSASIYPYSVSANLDGIGTVTVINQRGLTDHSKVNLIPINSTLKLKKINYESEAYLDIYENIAGFLKGKKYNKGFSLVFSSGNADTLLSNELFVSIPSTKKIQTILYATNDNAGELKYQLNEGRILIDLSQNPDNLKALVLLTNRTYLKWWQITLIVVSVCLVVGTALTVFFVLRSKKKKEYSDKETI